MRINCFSNGSVFWSALACILLLTSGILGMLVMAELKEMPGASAPVSQALAVSVVEVQPEDVPVTLTGYGEVAVLNTVTLSAEVAGTLVYVNPKLEQGELLSKGDVVFRIDDVRYRTDAAALAAVVSRLESRISELEIRHGINRERLAIARQNRELAGTEFSRLKTLFHKHRVGSRSDLDRAEQVLNTSKDLSARLSQAVETFPRTLAQVRSELAEARAGLAAAREDVRRCTVHAPFDGRVKTVSAEQGAFMTQGRAVAALADDRILEIHVALDSRDVRQWLLFDEPAGPGAWFTGLARSDCRIALADGAGPDFWTGRLHRVVRFNPGTRTLVLAVRVGPGQVGLGQAGTGPVGAVQAGAVQAGTGLPLVEGMFCRVEIPGRTMEQVFRLPGPAVGFEKQVCVSDNGRLKTVPVEVVRVQGDETFVRATPGGRGAGTSPDDRRPGTNPGGRKAGLNPGDRVIVTPLANPVDNTALIHIPVK